MLKFDQAPLSEVATEFNRYNRRQIVVTDPAAAAIRIGGTFQASNVDAFARLRSEEHTSELQSLMRISYAVFCLKKKKQQQEPQSNMNRTTKDNTNTTIIHNKHETHKQTQQHRQ